MWSFYLLMFVVIKKFEFIFEMHASARAAPQH